MRKKVAKVQIKDRKKGGMKKAPLVIDAAREDPAPGATHERDPRLPAAGTILAKQRGKETYEVTVLTQGFEYRGETYRSLSKIARLISGVSWNGFAFFGRALRNAPGSAQQQHQGPGQSWSTTGDRKESPPHEMSKCGRGSQQSSKEPF
jgi:hypothetical protein